MRPGPDDHDNSGAPVLTRFLGGGGADRTVRPMIVRRSPARAAAAAVLLSVLFAACSSPTPGTGGPDGTVPVTDGAGTSLPAPTPTTAPAADPSAPAGADGEQTTGTNPGSDLPPGDDAMIPEDTLPATPAQQFPRPAGTVAFTVTDGYARAYFTVAFADAVKAQKAVLTAAGWELRRQSSGSGQWTFGVYKDDIAFTGGIIDCTIGLGDGLEGSQCGPIADGVKAMLNFQPINAGPSTP